jgi:uncharacterized SAM-binding protein YcdF (DUF218 family)
MLFRFLTAVVLLLSVAWMGGLVWFVSHLDDPAVEPTRPVDAIVVLTGGSLRIDAGLQLLVAHRGRTLFVSGVHPGIDAATVLRLTGNAPLWIRCCVVLGHASYNTSGNAVETAAWLQREGYHSIRLVTANYHMKRSLLEFRRALPDDVLILPYPVFPEASRQGPEGRWRGTAHVIVVEYTKYLGACFRAILLDRIRGLAPLAVPTGSSS